MNAKEIEEKLEKEIDLNIDADEITLTDLIDVSILQKMQDSFSKMARMAALTSDHNGVAVTEGSNFSEFCMEYCRKSPIGKARCEQCDKMGAVMALEQHKPVSYFCHANLVDFAAPIMLGDRMIGSFIGGQVLSEEPDLDKMREVAKEIGVDEEGFIEAAKKTQIVPKHAIERSTNFIYEFASILSDMAYKEYVSRQLSVQAMQAAAQKSDFLANMSHEIRTPMNAVLGMAELALREEMTDQAKQYLHQIRASGKNLLVIINDILDFSKIESGKMNIVEVVYEPLSIINDLSNVVNSRIGNKKLEYTVDLDPTYPYKVLGDNIRIHQILLNLLNNAVKFTKEGNVHLTFGYEWIDNEHIMMKASVKDTGTGIKKEDLGKLFKSFQQVDSKRNRNIEGTGLGLAISQKLLNLMGGSVSVESEYEHGSTFSVQIPQQVIVNTPLVDIHETDLTVSLLLENTYVSRQIIDDLNAFGVKWKNLRLSGGRLEDAEGTTLILDYMLYRDSIKAYVDSHPEMNVLLVAPYDVPNDISIGDNVRVLKKPVYSSTLFTALGLGGTMSDETGDEGNEFVFTAPDAHILIVDDNPINLTVASGILEPLKMQVDTAGGAAETIEKVRQLKYDIIFMDHMMPEVDGVETTHIIRRLLPDYNDVPIIALTANAVGGTKEMFLKEGMNDFVAKPIETKEIVAMVRKWLPSEKIIPLSADEILNNTAEKKETIVIEGLNTAKAIPLLGTEKLYMQVLKEYYTAINKRADILNTALNNGDIKGYTIEVHSLKSTSRQIGADELADLAFELEKAGNTSNIGFIVANNSKLMEMYAHVKEILSGVFPDINTEKQDLSQADSETSRELLEKMVSALEDMDTLAIDDVLEEMSGYSYSDEATALFGKLKEAAEDCDLDLCGEIVESWKKLL